MIKIRLNGKEKNVVCGITLHELITGVKLDPKCVIAELNRDIVDSHNLKDTTLTDGDCLELINFVGGG